MVDGLTAADGSTPIRDQPAKTWRVRRLRVNLVTDFGLVLGVDLLAFLDLSPFSIAKTPASFIRVLVDGLRGFGHVGIAELVDFSFHLDSNLIFLPLFLLWSWLPRLGSMTNLGQ